MSALKTRSRNVLPIGIATFSVAVSAYVLGFASANAGFGFFSMQFTVTLIYTSILSIVFAQPTAFVLALLLVGLSWMSSIFSLLFSVDSSVTRTDVPGDAILMLALLNGIFCAMLSFIVRPVVLMDYDLIDSRNEK